MASIFFIRSCNRGRPSQKFTCDVPIKKQNTYLQNKIIFVLWINARVQVLSWVVAVKRKWNEMIVLTITRVSYLNQIGVSISPWYCVYYLIIPWIRTWKLVTWWHQCRIKVLNAVKITITAFGRSTICANLQPSNGSVGHLAQSVGHLQNKK